MVPSKPDSLLPTRTVFRTDEPVQVDTPTSGLLTVCRLGDHVRTVDVEAGCVDLGILPAGGYAVTLTGPDGFFQSAVDVRHDPRSALRYGFVASYRPDANVEDVALLARRLHLTGIQFYDWAYRHADLMGGTTNYIDALDQTISLETVQRLITALHHVGTDALGYAAVYGVGADEWPQWADLALVGPDGQPASLGDFLWIVDPGAPRWLDHFTTDLANATSLGFDGFHLDQYGYPRLALTPTGDVVDVAQSFVTMIDTVRAALPDARLCFNNVNDFPVWATTQAPQDVTYIEPWPPHVTYGSLAKLASRARSLAPQRPVVIAAYQSVYDTSSRSEADQATRLTMATLASHGATQLLAGEAGHVLVDPYYVRNHPADPATLDMLQSWYDFIVAQGELLFDPAITDVTGSWYGPYNETITLETAHHPVSLESTPGALWVRVTQIRPGRLVIHVINLTDQPDELWDAPKQPPGRAGIVALRIKTVGQGCPTVHVGDPDRGVTLQDVPGRLEGTTAVYGLPEPGSWQVILVDLI